MEVYFKENVKKKFTIVKKNIKVMRMEIKNKENFFYGFVSIYRDFDLAWKDKTKVVSTNGYKCADFDKIWVIDEGV